MEPLVSAAPGFGFVEMMVLDGRPDAEGATAATLSFLELVETLLATAVQHPEKAKGNALRENPVAMDKGPSRKAEGEALQDILEGVMAWAQGGQVVPLLDSLPPEARPGETGGAWPIKLDVERGPVAGGEAWQPHAPSFAAGSNGIQGRGAAMSSESGKGGNGRGVDSTGGLVLPGSGKFPAAAIDSPSVLERRTFPADMGAPPDDPGSLVDPGAGSIHRVTGELARGGSLGGQALAEGPAGTAVSRRLVSEGASEPALSTPSPEVQAPPGPGREPGATPAAVGPTGGREGAVEAADSAPEDTRGGIRDANQIVEKAVSWAQLAQKQGRTGLTVKLHPEELGTLTVRFTYEGDTITAGFTVSSQEARRALLEGLPGLRQKLAEHGIGFDALGVDVGMEGHRGRWTWHNGATGHDFSGTVPRRTAPEAARPWWRGAGYGPGGRRVDLWI